MAIKGGQGVVMLSDASPAFNQKFRMHKELSKALTLLNTDKEAGNKAYLEALDVFAAIILGRCAAPPAPGRLADPDLHLRGMPFFRILIRGREGIQRIARVFWSNRKLRHPDDGGAMPQRIRPLSLVRAGVVSRS